jgi:hypothetical protein
MSAQNVSKIVRVTMCFSVSLNKLHTFIYVQVCCGSGEKPGVTEEIKANYPECHLEDVEGKT